MCFLAGGDGEYDFGAGKLYDDGGDGSGEGVSSGISDGGVDEVDYTEMMLIFIKVIIRVSTVMWN